MLAWSVVGRSGTLLGRFSVGGSSCSIQLCRSVHIRSAIEEVFPFWANVPLLSRMLVSCHLVDVVASHGLSLHFLSGLSVWRWGSPSRCCRLLNSVHPVTVYRQRSSVNDPYPNHHHHHHQSRFSQVARTGELYSRTLSVAMDSERAGAAARRRVAGSGHDTVTSVRRLPWS